MLGKKARSSIETPARISRINDPASRKRSIQEFCNFTRKRLPMGTMRKFRNDAVAVTGSVAKFEDRQGCVVQLHVMALRYQHEQRAALTAPIDANAGCQSYRA